MTAFFLIMPGLYRHPAREAQAKLSAIDSANRECYSFPMRRITTITLALLLPIAAMAQTYSNAPLVVVGNGKLLSESQAAEPPPATPNAAFPENAITSVQAHSANPAAPATPATPATPASPPSPDAPKNPTARLWPYDTIPLFMPSCIRFHEEFIEPCTCVITQVMNIIPHDEFLRLNATGQLDQDPRIVAINQRCMSKPREKK